MLDARVVHQNIAAPCIGDQLAAFFGFRHIRLDIARGHAGFVGDVFRNSVVFVAVGKGVQHNIRPRPRQCPSDAKPNTGIGPRDDCCFS